MQAKIDNYNSWVETADHEAIIRQLEEILTTSGFTILNFMEHHFTPQGYTALWLLAESHCALHTFPEENRSYVELSSCNTQMFVDFVRLFNGHFHQTR